MARLPRLDGPGAWHHVMHRGARREPIFRRDDHCILLLDCIDEAVARHGLEVHAFALMPNHYHLLGRTRLGNLSRCMQHVNATYTQRLNRRFGWDGPVFRGRFRSQLVGDERYLDHLFAYVHLNPFEAGLASRLDEPCWTSLRAYLGKEQGPRWLQTDFFAARLGGRNGIQELIRTRRKRPDDWPGELDRESGWIRVGQPARPAPALVRPLAVSASIDEVLRRVAMEAACSVKSLKTPQMGSGANPARRLAVWALDRAQRHTYREIASALGMSVGQVANVLWRLRRERPGEPLATWMGSLAEV